MKHKGRAVMIDVLKFFLFIFFLLILYFGMIAIAFQIKFAGSTYYHQKVFYDSTPMDQQKVRWPG
jgi:predicted membrane protein